MFSLLSFYFWQPLWNSVENNSNLFLSSHFHVSCQLSYFYQPLWSSVINPAKHAAAFFTVLFQHWPTQLYHRVAFFGRYSITLHAAHRWPGQQLVHPLSRPSTLPLWATPFASQCCTTPGSCVALFMSHARLSWANKLFFIVHNYGAYLCKSRDAFLAHLPRIATSCSRPEAQLVAAPLPLPLFKCCACARGGGSCKKSVCFIEFLL